MPSNQRILQVFELAHEAFYKLDSNRSQKSANWKKYDERIFNLENLCNFRQENGLSRNCDDNHGMNLSNLLKEEPIKRLGEEYILKNMDKINIGNSPYNILYKNVYLDANKILILLWFRILYHSFDEEFMPNSFCEIGGGYGCFADIIINNLDIKLLSIDLPEANLLTGYYLKEKYQNKSFFLYDNYLKDEFLSLDDFKNHDIIILPPNCNIDEKIKLDLFINTRSMMEMNFHIIESYFDFINAHISENGYFLNINRYEKRTVGEAIRLADYPYGKEWEVIHAEPSPGQNHMHYLLTKKTNDPEKQNIELLLENIRKYVLNNPILKGPGGFKP